MNIWKGFGSLMLLLGTLLLGLIGGATIGGSIGDAMDMRNGTWGKGFSPNSLGLMLLGGVLGMVGAGVALKIAWGFYNRRR